MAVNEDNSIQIIIGLVIQERLLLVLHVGVSRDFIEMRP